MKQCQKRVFFFLKKIIFLAGVAILREPSALIANVWCPCIGLKTKQPLGSWQLGKLKNVYWITVSIDDHV
jgi:hypothetical protein